MSEKKGNKKQLKPAPKKDRTSVRLGAVKKETRGGKKKE
jgi:hypothetical protein